MLTKAKYDRRAENRHAGSKQRAGQGVRNSLNHKKVLSESTAAHKRACANASSTDYDVTGKR